MRLQTTEFSEIGLTHGNGLYAVITPFKVIQGHRFWYQSKPHMRLPISDYSALLVPFSILQFIPTFQVQYLFYTNCIYGINEIIQ